ncbi:hypothetical protein B0O99DRAFT_523643 [Bisporella sp. PMI_857]|nr:hypothetical protein B0O99DRAFT_523643 [Bisporella sp. PMI_857]
MVNLGKPSKDCLPCRKRKLRCDLLPEGCGQCQRAKLRCHGYRNPRDLLFRDETHSTQQKVVARQGWAYSGSPTTLEFGWDVRARYAFFSIYVSSFSRSCGELASFYRRAPSFDYLSASVEASSLAFMGIRLNNPWLMRLANGSYVTAIQRLSQALNGLNISETEEALQSVLLLDMYEKMVNRNPRGSASWMSHVHGAMSIVNIRGKKILSSFTGRQLAIRLATVLTVSCAVAAVRVPDTLMALRRDLDPFVNNVKWSFTGILAHLINLQADLQKESGVCPIDITERAKRLEDQVKNLGSTLPLTWKPQRVYYVGEDTRIFGHYYEIYPDHYITQISNGIRAMRLMLIDIIRRHSPDNVFNTDSSIFSDIRNITEEICATVPQFVLPGAHPDNTASFSPLQCLQCYTLLPPLYLASQVSADYHMRDWIGYCLNYISANGHIKAAKDIADMIKTKTDLSYWTVYATMGSYAFTA